MFPHMMIAMFACYLFQFFFWELPATTGYYEPFHFEFQEGSFFMADPEDATSLGVATQAQVITGVHTAFEKMKFASPNHDQVVASWPGTSSSVLTAGVGKDGQPFAAWDQGQPNGTGMGARWDMNGIDVGGFIWCAIGEFLDSESIEHNFPLLPIFRSIYWRDAAGHGKFRGGRSMTAMYQVHGVPVVAAVSMGGISGRPVASGLFGGYPSRPVSTAFIKNHNLAALIEANETPRDIYEAVDNLVGDWTVVHQNSGLFMLGDGDIYIGTAPSGPGYGDVLDRSPADVIQDLREGAISHWTAREVYKVVYREDNLVLDEEATGLARKQEREARIARATPYEQWEPGWLQKRPPEALLKMYGEWPNGLDTPLTDYEPGRDLLDEPVREYQGPRERPSRY
jgi:N-methylhydantoinase B/oxoprolinase/acetone carboxylase alpha subunit